MKQQPRRKATQIMNPEDIAREVTWRLTSQDDVRGREWIWAAIVEAIEIDRTLNGGE